ncbi:MAG: hypothetical protein K1X57_15715 [Gemmataceae bacterium]|nr:hypothetical protein [Gemmataceae bacterium]
MFRKLMIAAAAFVGLGLFGSTAQAHPPYGAYYGSYYGAGVRPYYAVPQVRYGYYNTPYAGYAYRSAAYGPYYNYGYQYYARPVAPVYNPYYYGPRVGVGYYSPRVGIYGGF